MVAFSVVAVSLTKKMSPLTPGSTTWLLVSTCPLPSMTKPEPVADPSLPASTLIVTMLGSATAAMLATEPAGRCVAPGPGSGSVVPARWMRSCASWPATPPTIPESRHRPTTSAASLPRPRRGAPRASVSGTPPGGTDPASAPGSPAGAWGTGPTYAGWTPPTCAPAPGSVELAGPAPGESAGADDGTWAATGGA